MNNEKRQKIQEFALDTADKFEYLIKRLKRAVKSKNLELSTLEEITDEIQTAYSKLREYIDEKTGKSGKTTGTPLFSFTEGSF
ncbi:MAG: hypothetical protein SPK88_08525 [Synergistales bacterium]|nr:hypothetical protein [Synergistales bacterium]